MLMLKELSVRAVGPEANRSIYPQTTGHAGKRRPHTWAHG